MALSIAALVLSSGLAIGVSALPASAARSTLYVNNAGTVGTDTSCSDPGFTSIQAAVNAATSGTTVRVCPGIYDEQVTVNVSDITIQGAGASSTTIDPTTSSPTTMSDLDTGQTIVPIVDVAGQADVTIADLTVEGSGLSNGFSGCSDNFVGVLFQNASGALADAIVDGVELPTSLFGCQDGLAVFAQSSSGQTSLTVAHSSITSYDKGGVVCVDANTTCSVAFDTISGVGATDLIGQNGVQIGPGAPGSVVNHNAISGNDFTGSPNTTEPQADYAAGVLLYGATGNVGVDHNSLADNQIGIETVASNATIDHNSLSQSASGIANSVGIFAVACDYYCWYFGLSGDSNVADSITHNEISFPGAPTAGTVGIWTNDSAANSRTGLVIGEVDKNVIAGAAQDYLTS